MKIISSLVFCLSMISCAAFATVQENKVSLHTVYNYLAVYNHATQAFHEKNGSSEKTSVLLSKARLLNAIMNLCNNSDTTAGQKEECLKLVQSILNETPEQQMLQFDEKAALN